MPFALGEIVLVPFPFTNQQASKKRPAVVVSSATYNRIRSDLVVMAVTSQFRPSGGFGEVVLRDWKVAGLLAASAIKPVVATLEQRLVLRSLGHLSATDQGALRAAIRQIIS